MENKRDKFIERRFIEWQNLAEQLLAEKLKLLLNEARNVSLLSFDKYFAESYIIKKEVVDALNDDIIMVPARLRVGIFSFKYNRSTNYLDNILHKAGTAPLKDIQIVSEINDDPFNDALSNATNNAYMLGGQSVLSAFDIIFSFKALDPTVAAWLSNYQIQLSRSIASSISNSIRFEILEGMRNAESIPQIRSRVSAVWNQPIDVVVPPKLDANGNVIRQGYTYQLSNEAWADVVARTEVSRAFAEGRLEAYRQMGSEIVTAVEYSATPDERLCPNCGALDGTVFSIKDAGGVIPLHARCRCTWIPIVNEGDISKLKEDATVTLEEIYSELDSVI